MQISIEGKIAILLGLLALGGSGAVWVAPDHTEIGWCMIGIAILGLIALGAHHAIERHWIGRRFMPILLMIAGIVIFFSGVIWLGLRQEVVSTAHTSDNPHKSSLDRTLLAECQFAVLPDVVLPGPFFLIQLTDSDADGVGSFGQAPGTKINWEGMGNKTGAVCRITNYGTSPVLNAEAKLRIQYRSIIKHDNGAQAGALVKERTLTMPRMNLGVGDAGVGQIYFINRSEYFVNGQLYSHINAQKIGSSEIEGAELIAPSMPFNGGFNLSPFRPEPPREPSLYFSVDIPHPENLSEPVPGRVTNTEDGVFQAVDSWFSPSAAKRDPHSDNQLYWSLRSLKYSNGLLHKGSVLTGKQIPPGDYCIEYHGLYKGTSLAFVERLQIISYENKLIDVIDVWDGNTGEKLYTSPRPEGFKDTSVPWLVSQ